MTYPGTVRTEQLNFSSEAIPAAGRLKALQEFFFRFDRTIRVAPIASAPITVVAEYQHRSTVSLLFCQTGPISISWSPEGGQADGRDFRLFRVTSGDYRITARELPEDLTLQAPTLVSKGAELSVLIERPTSFVLMSVQKELLSPETCSPDAPQIFQIEEDNPALRLLIAYQDFLHGKEVSSDRPLALKVGQHLVDLMSITLASVAGEQPHIARPAREARLEAIKSDVRANLAQVRLSAKTVAKRHGVTDRYIHKLFEETGETFGRYVMEERLKRAYRLLLAPPYTVPIGSIALEVGFGELSTFNRAFKRRFGDTPSGIRRKHNSQKPVREGRHTLRRDTSSDLSFFADIQMTVCR